MEKSAAVIWAFFALHWFSCVFFQTFYLHRYGAHKMFTMNRFWERFFHLGTFISQGSSYLVPRAYAILHREHHAYSDTEKDPHSPHHAKGFADMMLKTKARYAGFVRRQVEPEERFAKDIPSWDLVDRLGDTWVMRVAFGTAYTLFYIAFAPHWAYFLLLPIHYLMGPVHGAIVNWGGHKYGYRNFGTPDKSKNTLPFDFVTMGELFQNNHHERGASPNFAMRVWELDPTYPIIWILDRLGVIRLKKRQIARVNAAQLAADNAE